VKAAQRLFGTDGVRGLANREPMTPETTLRVGRALGIRCRGAGARRAAVVIGRDTRRSGDMLEAALVAGLCSAGVDALLAGIVPTPAVAVLTRETHAAAGAVVSASHNPSPDNGVKLFGHDGFKLPDAFENEVADWVLHGGVDDPRPTAGEVGRAVHLADAAARYQAFLRQLLPGPSPLQGMRVVIDCANGAAYQIGPTVLEQLGARVVALGVHPDGDNINCAAGALHPGQLRDAVLASAAHLGIGLDGDADRLILVDEGGAIVDGDEVLAIMADEMLAQGTLKQSTVVATVMSNLGLELCLRERGARLVRTAVGDRYVVEEMLRQGCNLGGEQSGHLLFLDHGTTGDGLVAALRVLCSMSRRQRSLGELKRIVTKFPQALVNVPVRECRELAGVALVRQAIDRAQAELGDRGRILVRYSGTEPLVRVMVEGEVPERVQAYAEEIAAAVRAALG
jgi:phosphoglucosamine mutase